MASIEQGSHIVLCYPLPWISHHEAITCLVVVSFQWSEENSVNGHLAADNFDSTISKQFCHIGLRGTWIQPTGKNMPVTWNGFNFRRGHVSTYCRVRPS